MSVQEEVLLFLEREFFLPDIFALQSCMCVPSYRSRSPKGTLALMQSGSLFIMPLFQSCLCPHSLLCEFFEQLIASVEKKIRTCWIF